MKSLILAFLVLQTLGSTAQKKLDNTIVIDTVRSLKDIKTILFKNGYTIDGTDTSFFITTAKQMTAAVLRLMISRTDTSIVIKGQAKMEVEFMGIKSDFESVEYRPSKQNLNYGWFGEMNKIAKQIGNKITYLKQ